MFRVENLLTHKSVAPQQTQPNDNRLDGINNKITALESRASGVDSRFSLIESKVTTLENESKKQNLQKSYSYIYSNGYPKESKTVYFPPFISFRNEISIKSIQVFVEVNPGGGTVFSIETTGINAVAPVITPIPLRYESDNVLYKEFNPLFKLAPNTKFTISCNKPIAISSISITYV